jgi:SAM-dependent methyltransferase
MSYRDSHRGAGNGARYDEVYTRGYYAALWREVERPMLEQLFAELRAGGARSLLDFACGTGRILSVAEAHFDQTWGVDVSATMIERARARCPRSTLRLFDLTRAPSSPPLGRRFDVIAAFRFFLNAEPALRREALAAIDGSLAEGGTLVANIHVNAHSPMGLFYRARNRLLPSRPTPTLSADDFILLLADAGFAVTRVQRYGYLPRPGPLLPGWVERAVPPVERAMTRLGVVPASLAQGFWVVAQRAG